MVRIEVKNLEVGYEVAKKGGRLFSSSRQFVKALDDVSFNLEKGDKLAVIGPNGGGKSTLLKVLSESLPAQRGVVKVTGEKLSILNRGYGLMPSASLNNNAKLKAYSMGLSGQSVIDFTERCIYLADLIDKAEHPLSTLSAGMQGRFNLALNTQLIKEIMILDEWVGELEENQSRHNGLLAKLIDNVDIIVLASHNQSLVRKLCNKVLLLDEGELKYFGEDINVAFKKLNALNKGKTSQDQIYVGNQRQKENINIIHPKKTGRYIVDKLLKKCQPQDHKVFVHGEGVCLSDIPADEKVIIFGRHPVERFVRIFHARKNAGGPFYNSKRTNAEYYIFEKYPTVNSLIESMVNADQQTSVDAYLAFAELQKKADNLTTYFLSESSSDEVMSNILFYASLDDPKKAIDKLFKVLNISDRYEFLLNSFEEEYFEKKYSNELSALAIKQLNVLYSHDIKLHNELLSLYK